MILRQVRPLRERLFEKIQICEHGAACTECHWDWLAGKKRGQGKFFLRKEGKRGHKRTVSIRAQVMMWVVAYGTVPHRGQIRETCDHFDCMNFNHLGAHIFHTNSLHTAYILEGLNG